MGLQNRRAPASNANLWEYLGTTAGRQYACVCALASSSLSRIYYTCDSDSIGQHAAAGRSRQKMFCLQVRTTARWKSQRVSVHATSSPDAKRSGLPQFVRGGKPAREYILSATGCTLHGRRYKENKLFHGTVTYSIVRNADMQLPCLPARKIKQRVVVGVQLSTYSTKLDARLHVCYSPCLLPLAWQRTRPIHILHGQVTVPGSCLSVMRSPRQPCRVKPIS